MGGQVRYCSPRLERPKEAATQAATRMKPLVLRWRRDMLLPLLPLLLVFEPCECASEGRVVKSRPVRIRAGVRPEQKAKGRARRSVRSRGGGVRIFGRNGCTHRTGRARRCRPPWIACTACTDPYRCAAAPVEGNARRAVNPRLPAWSRQAFGATLRVPERRTSRHGVTRERRERPWKTLGGQVGKSPD